MNRTQLRHYGRELKIAATGYARSIQGRPGSLPSFLIIGAQRGGTTSLFNYLAAHPDVVPPHSKELHFYSRWFERGEQWYRGNFPTVSAPQQTFEATPLYLFQPEVPERVHRLQPDVRLVAILRDPVKRAYSHYVHNVEHGTETLSFADALAVEPARLALNGHGRPTAPGKAVRKFSYTQRGMYADQLERWFACFPREQIMVIRSEDMYATAAETYAGLLDFLGLRPFTDISFERHNHWKDGKTQLTPELVARLREVFAEPNRRLETLLGWSSSWDYTH